MAVDSFGSNSFSVDIELPVLLNGRRQTSPARVVFKKIPREALTRWMLDQDGCYRSDKDLLTEVLLDVVNPYRPTQRSATAMLNDAIGDERTAAFLVAVFLQHCQAPGPGQTLLQDPG